jgi:hypothetical protein
MSGELEPRAALAPAERDRLAELVPLPAGEASAIGWAPARELGYDEWVEHGRAIARVQAAAAWWLGDWWRYGEHRYGDRLRAVDDLDGLPPFQTCRNAGWVAGAIETSRRRDVLSWSHHAEVAALEPAEQEHWLDAAEQDGWSQKRLREELRSRREPDSGNASRWRTFAAGRDEGEVVYRRPPVDAELERAIAEAEAAAKDAAAELRRAETRARNARQAVTALRRRGAGGAGVFELVLAYPGSQYVDDDGHVYVSPDGDRVVYAGQREPARPGWAGWGYEAAGRSSSSSRAERAAPRDPDALPGQLTVDEAIAAANGGA